MNLNLANYRFLTFIFGFIDKRNCVRIIIILNCELHKHFSIFFAKLTFIIILSIGIINTRSTCILLWYILNRHKNGMPNILLAIFLYVFNLIDIIHRLWIFFNYTNDQHMLLTNKKCAQFMNSKRKNVKIKWYFRIPNWNKIGEKCV